MSRWLALLAFVAAGVIRGAVALLLIVLIFRLFSVYLGAINDALKY